MNGTEKYTSGCPTIRHTFGTSTARIQECFKKILAYNEFIKVDIATLRSNHHICGILTGTLPHLSQQNVFLGIPLVLLPEEVVLLVENGTFLAPDSFKCRQYLLPLPGIAVLVDDSTAHLQPSLSDLESWNNEQQALFRQQIAANEVKTAKKENTRSLSEEAMKKRKEREERKRLAAQRLAEEANAGDINTPSPQVLESMRIGDRETTVATPQSATPEQTVSSANYTITVPAASEYRWYSSDKATFTTIEAAQKANVWTYPSNLYERARCGVFRSLWEQGYFMGSGIKFGGDYLVYPGSFVISASFVNFIRHSATRRSAEVSFALRCHGY